MSFVDQKNAKHWRHYGHCKAHLTNTYKDFQRWKRDCPYDACEIVEFELTENKTIPIMEALLESHERRKKR
jgi:hypothetical protein